MKNSSGRIFVAAGVVLTLLGLLMFSFAAPSVTVGQETDVGLPTDVGDDIGDDVDDGTQPPASLPDDGADSDVGDSADEPIDQAGPAPSSLPDSGNGGYLEQASSPRVLLMTLLAALGITLSGVGAIAVRNTRRA